MNKEITSAIYVSLIVTLSAVFISFIIGSILSYFILKYNMKKSRFFFSVISSIPPVLAGLVVFLIFSKQGIFGSSDILYTIKAMIIAQCILILPIYITITTGINNRIFKRQLNTLEMLEITGLKKYKTLFFENRILILTALSTSFARGLSEVGAVMLVGGNIKYETRTMTTYIATSTSEGYFNEAITLGVILLLFSLLINVFIIFLRGKNNDQ